MTASVGAMRVAESKVRQVVAFQLNFCKIETAMQGTPVVVTANSPACL